MRVSANSPEAKIIGKNRIKALSFFLMAALVGIAGLFLVMHYLDQIKNNVLGGGAVATETQPVVVAAMDLPIATTLEKKHLSVIFWPKRNVPKGIHTKMDSLIGRTTVQSLVKNEPVLKSRLADGSTAGMAALLEPGKRAMAVKVDSVVGVAGFVQPGDFVDVITTMTPDDETKEFMENEAAKISKIILQNIKVLAVGEHMSTENRKPIKVKVVTLEVTSEESEKLALGSQHGQVQLTMRPKIDQSEDETLGVTPLSLLVSDADVDAIKQKALADAQKEEEKQKLAVNMPAPQKEAKTYKKKTQRKKRVKDERPKEVVAKKPAAPVVEILRGGDIEKRKLMRSNLN